MHLSTHHTEEMLTIFGDQEDFECLLNAELRSYAARAEPVWLWPHRRDARLDGLATRQVLASQRFHDGIDAAIGWCES